MYSIKHSIDIDGRVGELTYLIGWVYNEGPPHDHNRIWKDSRYLEDLHPSWFDRIVDGEGFIVYENGEALLYDGRLILDLYKIL